MMVTVLCLDQKKLMRNGGAFQYQYPSTYQDTKCATDTHVDRLGTDVVPHHQQ